MKLKFELMIYHLINVHKHTKVLHYTPKSKISYLLPLDPFCQARVQDNNYYKNWLPASRARILSMMQGKEGTVVSSEICKWWVMWCAYWMNKPQYPSRLQTCVSNDLQFHILEVICWKYNISPLASHRLSTTMNPSADCPV